MFKLSPLRRAALALALVLFPGAGLANAQPYEFIDNLDSYTWGEDSSGAVDSLGEPYSQDSGGLTYLVDDHWIKRIQLTPEGKVWQVTEQMLYPLNSERAGQEYRMLREWLSQAYGPPTAQAEDCPVPAPDGSCHSSRWDQHPEVQIFVVQTSTASNTVVLLAYGSPSLRRQARQESRVMDIADLITAYRRDYAKAAGRYQGQTLEVIGQSGGMGRDPEGRLYINLHNAFDASQTVRCYLRAGQEFDLQPYSSAVSLLATGTAGEYKEGILRLENCAVSRP
ncbi:MAG: hypothetical protein LBJ14_10760 [Desulfarculales bacterium]|jgi:hypothetical protein|nr:hypothetical protein [Desulfarculales bacterium]